MRYRTTFRLSLEAFRDEPVRRAMVARLRAAAGPGPTRVAFYRDEWPGCIRATVDPR